MANTLLEEMRVMWNRIRNYNVRTGGIDKMHSTAVIKKLVIDKIKAMSLSNAIVLTSHQFGTFG